jgi:excisionase family DNA binding protein
MSSDELLTVAETAQLFKLNQQTVRNWIDRGELPCVRVGRRVRIRLRARLPTLRFTGMAPFTDPGWCTDPLRSHSKPAVSTAPIWSRRLTLLAVTAEKVGVVSVVFCPA